jgi:Holliday junction DNA helicase RuvA
MITGVTGLVEHVGEDRLELSMGPVRLEVLVPAGDVPGFEGTVGQELTLHTMAYLEGDASGGNLTPRLIGFARESDRGFFATFITVKGIGPRKALRALAIPAGEVARAIETGDARALTKLPQIGKRAAETIIAELSGKVGRFVPSGREPATPRRETPAGPPMTDAEADAVAALVSLGERRGDAEAVLGRIKQRDDAPTDTGGLVREMLRLRGGSR